MKTVCVFSLLLCPIYAASDYWEGTSRPGELALFQNCFEKGGKHREMDYPSDGYSSKFTVSRVKVIDFGCVTKLSSNAINNYYGELIVDCIGIGSIDSCVEVYGVYDGPCFKERARKIFEDETNQKSLRGYGN